MNTIRHDTRQGRRWWALAAIILAVLAVGIDQTVLSLALPTLARELHASNTDLQWFVAAFSLALCAALLPAGALGDRFGRKKLLIVALVVFGAGSLACAYSATAAQLIGARVILGVGAAFLIPLPMAVMTDLFTEAERPAAVGIWGAANFLAFPIGPILGGWMLTRFWWGSVFLMNVPVVILGLIAVIFLVPESRSAKRPGLDPLGIVLSSAGLVGLAWGVIQAGQNGWGDVTALLPLVAGAALVAGFVLWERAMTARAGAAVASAAPQRSSTPQTLVDLRLFASPRFTWGTTLAAFSVFAMSGLLFALPQLFVAVSGTDSMGAGVRLLPMVGGLIVGAVSSSRLAARAGAKATATLGFALLAAGLIAGTTTTEHSSYGLIAAWVAVAGAGMGLALAAAVSGALADLPADRSGSGSAVMQAVQKVGLPFGAAILGAVFNSTYRAHLDLNGLPSAAAATVQKSVFAGLSVAAATKSTALLSSVRSAFVHGMSGMLWVCGATALACAIIALLFLPSRVPAGAPRGVGAPREERVE